METTDATTTTACRGIRGAIVLHSGEAEEPPVIQLIDEILMRNGCAIEDVASIIFTLTDDLAGSNPAAILRRHGFESVPLLMVREHAEGHLARCLRVLVLVNTARTAAEIKHAYLGDAAALRSDLVAIS